MWLKFSMKKQVDELVVFDIDATVFKKEPNYSLIEKLASQSMMPLCYGGGVKLLNMRKRYLTSELKK